MQAVLILTMCLVLASGSPTPSERIIGGSVTTISTYPSIAALLYSSDLSNFRLRCGSTILNNRNLLTTADCVSGYSTARFRVRVGSSYSDLLGSVHQIQSYVTHPYYNSVTNDNDIGVLHTTLTITLVPNAVQPATIAGTLYELGDNELVSIAGWGSTTPNGATVDQLRQVQVLTVNQFTCANRYGIGAITDNMLCAGWLDVGGRDACNGDGGGPLYHNGVVVGITSWGRGCAQSYYPGVYTRVSRFTPWIAASII